MPAGLIALGAGAADAGWTRIAEYDRRDPAALGEHELRHLADLPLGPVAASEGEEMQELPRSSVSSNGS